jgi:hypothetical protein
VKILQRQLEEERRQRLAEREASEQRMRESEQMMRDMITYMQTLGAATGVAPPTSLFVPPPPPPPEPLFTPVSMDKF